VPGDLLEISLNLVGWGRRTKKKDGGERPLPNNTQKGDGGEKRDLESNETFSGKKHNKRLVATIGEMNQ